MHSHWMKEALLLAKTAAAFEEVPVGAVIVQNHLLIGRGYNQVRQRKDPTAHAEILAIQDACRHVANERLQDAILYVTLEPCIMCMGAILHARLPRLVFGARDLRAGAAGSQCNLAHGLNAYGTLQIEDGILQPECSEVLRLFFQDRR